MSLKKHSNFLDQFRLYGSRDNLHDDDDGGSLTESEAINLIEEENINSPTKSSTKSKRSHLRMAGSFVKRNVIAGPIDLISETSAKLKNGSKHQPVPLPEDGSLKFLTSRGSSTSIPAAAETTEAVTIGAAAATPSNSKAIDSNIDDGDETGTKCANSQKVSTNIKTAKSKASSSSAASSSSSSNSGMKRYIDIISQTLLYGNKVPVQTITINEMFVISVIIAGIPTLLARNEILTGGGIPLLVVVSWIVAAIVLDRINMSIKLEEERKQKQIQQQKKQQRPQRQLSPLQANDRTVSKELAAIPSSLEDSDRHTGEVIEEADEEEEGLLDEEIKAKYYTKFPEPPEPPTELPARFLAAGKGDPTIGQERYEGTLKWRKDNHIDYILYEPHEHFEIIKANYPHYYHLRGLNNELTYYEKPSKAKLQPMRDVGCTLDTLLRHMAFIQEFSWQHVERSDSAKSIYIVDIEGIGLRDFAGEVVDFVKQSSSFTGAHYPERLGTMMVLNVPSWFKIIWNVVKNWADEDTLKKIFILRGKQEILEALQEKIHIDNIPKEYGGNSISLGEAPEERKLWQLIKHQRSKFGITSKTSSKKFDESACCRVENRNGANDTLTNESELVPCSSIECYFCNFRLARSY